MTLDDENEDILVQIQEEQRKFPLLFYQFSKSLVLPICRGILGGFEIPVFGTLWTAMHCLEVEGWLKTGNKDHLFKISAKVFFCWFGDQKLNSVQDLHIKVTTKIKNLIKNLILAAKLTQL